MNLDQIIGIVDKILFANKETGFSVFIVNSKKYSSITVTGNFIGIQEGQEIHIQGSWSFHPKFGKQLQATSYSTTLPTSVLGIKKYLSSDFDALFWTLCYVTYAHAIDVLCDEPLTEIENKIFFLNTLELAADLYSYHFYINNINILKPIILMAGNAYMDSLIFEKSKVKWERNHADVTRQQANDVILAVIGIVCGLDKRREASLELRAIAYSFHHDKKGKPC